MSVVYLACHAGTRPRCCSNAVNVSIYVIGKYSRVLNLTGLSYIQQSGYPFCQNRDLITADTSAGVDV